MLLAVVDQTLLCEVRVNLNLVYSGLNLGSVHQIPQQRNAEVAHSDVPDQSLFHQLLHDSPSVNNWDFLHNNLGSFCWSWDILEKSWVGNFGVDVLECCWVVDQIEINILEAEIAQASVETFSDMFWFTECNPELCGNKELLSCYDLLVEGFLDTSTDLSLISVKCGTVDVSIS